MTKYYALLDYTDPKPLIAIVKGVDGIPDALQEHFCEDEIKFNKLDVNLAKTHNGTRSSFHISIPEYHTDTLIGIEEAFLYEDREK